MEKFKYAIYSLYDFIGFLPLLMFLFSKSKGQSRHWGSSESTAISQTKPSQVLPEA